MEVEYRRNYGQSYMVMKAEEIVASFDLTMLLENHVEGLLELEVAWTDGKQEYWYNISGKQALDVWFAEHRPGRRELKQLFFGIAAVLQNMKPFLLMESALSLKMTDIYVNPANGKFYFCYCPFQTKDFQKKMQEFMELFLQNMDHECNQDVQICYMIYENTRRENITIEDLLKCIQNEQDMQKEEEKEPWAQEVKQEDKAPDKNRKKKEIKNKTRFKIENKWIGEYELIKGRIKNGFWKSSKKLEEKKETGESFFREKIDAAENKLSAGQKKEFEEQYVAMPEDIVQEEIIHPTILLGSNQSSICGHLIYKGNNGEDSFILEEMPFYIGSYSKEVKGVLKSSTVSRIHSKITKEKEEYYIEDMNSTNGTYVNGEILSYRERRKLEKNDEIAFADVIYGFI